MSISSLQLDHEVEAVQLPAANGETKNRQPLPGHPLLRTWNPPSKHKFEGSQLRTFSSICDTFSPSMEPPAHRQGDIRPQNGRHGFDVSREESKTVEDVEAFYRCSASDFGVPKDIAGMLGAVLQPKVLVGIRLFIWLLSTRLGTVILCGRNGLSKTFPYFQVFSYLPRKQQEKVLQQWSRSSLTIFQAVYKLFKMLTLWAVYCKGLFQPSTVYSRICAVNALGMANLYRGDHEYVPSISNEGTAFAHIDKNGHNPLWKAIGYCGPDPEVVSRTVSTKPSNRLKDRVVDLTTAGDKHAKILNQTGCNVLDNIDHLRALMIQKRTGGEKSSSSEITEDVGISCDVVVVGSGCGGGVMAAVLAKAGYKVVILEKGKYFAREDFSTFEGPSQMVMYEKLGSLATDDGGVNLIAGTTVGGGTVINWSVCFKTPKHVLEEWRESSGVDLFTSPRYEQAMEEVWERLGTQSEVHNENFQNSVLREGCQKMGIEVGTLARNASPDHKCGWCTYGCPTGEKKSTAESWLVDAVDSGNAVILSGCEVQSVLHRPNPHGKGKKKKQARGVVAKIGDGPSKIFIEARATIVACGSLFTPPLLLNSGLSNPNIGKSLHLHPALFVWGYFPEGCGPPGTCYEGPVMSAYSPVYKRNSRFPCGLLETMSPHPGSFATFTPWTSGADFKERMRRYSRTATFCMVTRDDQSHGSVGVNVTGAPTFKYTLSAPDVDTVLVGLEQGLRVLIAAGAVEIGTHQQDGERFHAEGASDQEIDAYMTRVRARGVRKLQISMGSGHQMGSCKMGVDPSRSAVDAHCETWEVQGLYVADASVFPGALGVNPMVTIQSLAFCTAHSVLASLCPSE